MIDRISQLVVKYRYWVVAFWLLLAGIVFFTAPSLADVADFSSQGFLPSNVDSKRAEELLNRIGLERNGKTSLIISLSRLTNLGDTDEHLGQKICQELIAKRDALGIVTLVHPWLGPEYHQQLISTNKQSALIILGLDVVAYDPVMTQRVSTIRSMLKSLTSTSQGIEVHLSGEAAFSTDEHLIVNESMNTITLITIILVLAVLLAVFRSPITALLPLTVIGLSFLISRGLIAFASLAGLAVSAYTETFLIAVLFGAGTDYCILLISRYQDELRAGHPHAEALTIAQRWSSSAILSSGLTTLAGFIAMSVAVFGLYNSTGPAVAIGVAVAIIMVLSLTPALLAILGRFSFWPRRTWDRTLPRHQSQLDAQKPKIWIAIARLISARPGLVLLISIVCFLPSVIFSFMMQRSFDQVSEMPATSDARAGFEQISRDFGQGLLMPIKVVISSEKDLWGLRALPEIDSIASEIAALPGVSLVRAATRPTGIRLDHLPDPNRNAQAPDIDLAPEPAPDPDAPFFLPKIVINNNPLLKSAMEVFISSDGHTTSLDVILNQAPYIASSLDLTSTIRNLARQTLAAGWLDEAIVEVGGPSAMFADVRSLTASDFSLVMVLVLLVVLIILVVLLRSLIAPLYLLASILISFASTMGLSYLVFQVFLGYEGVNWAVQFFAFCVLVALGIDYNIFLMTRVQEEWLTQPGRPAIAAALVGTGKIITTCGLIMAGCFAAMLFSPIRSIQEVGFAVVVGMLIDTFLIRSFMVPAAASLLNQWNWWPKKTQR